MKTYDEDGMCVYVYAPNADINYYTERLLSRGRKEVTAKRYKIVLNHYCEMSAKIGRPTDPRIIDEDDVYTVLNEMNISLSSKESYSYIVRQWCRFYKNMATNSVRILTNGDTPNAKWISYADVVRSMEAAKTKSEAMIIYLGGSYGLRRAEIANLKVHDIRNGYMIIHGKGHGPDGKIRQVPLPGDTDPVIDVYLTYRQLLVEFCEEDHTEDRLLVKRIKKKLTGYSPERVGNVCKAIMTRAGVDGTTHSLRREFITSAYRADAKLLDIMRIVGHTDPKQTTRYIENDLDKLRETIVMRNYYISNKTMT